ncbi:MAG TPA: NAD(P)-dependent oxidoreductase [Pyrinomonadaceae bacterium]|nr:NAD(P)-dependent oxidoreductase [Pyrinomonadaceae bacterium]
MRTVLITGGAGFFGELLKQRLLDNGFQCVSIDLEEDHTAHPNLISIWGDIRRTETLEALFSKHKFEAIYHLAAILAHAVKDVNFLWTCNVDGTRNIAEFAKRYKVPKVVFTSSNCLWAEDFGRRVRETDVPKPAEVYGLSKWEGEKILLEHTGDFDSIIFRCPTIIDEGRLGLLSILFEFIDEGRKVWVVGGGDNTYQFIYGQDLAEACLKALDYRGGSNVFNIGSDHVKSFREVYDYVIRKAGTGARVASLPRALAIPSMKLAYKLKLSPLGPYQYKMIASSFEFDTTRIKQNLDWKPTLTNEEMLYKAYNYYHTNAAEIRARANVSAHKQPAKMGVIRVLKILS